MSNVKVTVFFECLKSTVLLTCTLANENPSSDKISQKNGPVRGNCIACDLGLYQIYIQTVHIRLAGTVQTDSFTISNQ